MVTFVTPPPPAKNYNASAISIVSRVGIEPPEGRRYVDLTIPWGAQGGANNCVSFDVGHRTNLNFSQIATLSIDNSGCGADVRFIFPDTQETITIPAYSPFTVVPVFSGSTFFYAYSPGALSTDVTNFKVHNYFVPPVAVPVTQEQNVANAQNISITASGSHPLTSTVNGTLENLSVFLNLFPNSGNPAFTWKIEDGTNQTIAAGQANANSTAYVIAEVCNLTDVHVRFQGGLTLSWTSANMGASSSISVNSYYRTP